MEKYQHSLCDVAQGGRLSLRLGVRALPPRSGMEIIMKRKTLYMIGNSHIDPVWFWDWDEGLQEVKATFASALDRLREFPEAKFTSTSSAFFEWIEAVAPDMFEEIRERVKEGRWELTGGWFLEPDCILPCGEAFVRQGLFGQRYFQEKFGVTCRTGSNVDSFGHNPMLPQILNKSGMKEYVFMRPRLDTPVFVWESEDGSRVNAISLPSEYTTWFYEPTKEAVEMAEKAARDAELSSMACCYGVGNHGGGPTVENIRAILRLREEKPELSLPFGTYREFFDSLTEEEKKNLPVRREFFDGVNTGCYSMDSGLKRTNRRTERRLLAADQMACMAAFFTGQPVNEGREAVLRQLWKTLLFNQFHDTLGGTTIKPARDEAIAQMSGAGAEAKKLWTASMQEMMGTLDTRGEGFPLILFNPSGRDYDGPVAAELNWFCKDGLILRDPDGKEIPYQRVHTLAKVRNYNIGGRRGIVFSAHESALGFAVYRTFIGESPLCCDSRESGGAKLEAAVMENEYLRVSLNKDGALFSLYDKRNGFEALSGPVTFPVWTDERDSWGGNQGRPFEPRNESLLPEALELVEKGELRQVVRATFRLGASVLQQDFILCRGADSVEVVNRLFWDREWQMLKMDLPLSVRGGKVYREAAYQSVCTPVKDGQEYSMHRFVDVTGESGAGLCIANDGKYAFSVEGNRLCFPIARSAIYAQGNGVNWYNPIEGYEYTDMGKQEFTFLLSPHGAAFSNAERYRLADLAAKPLLITADCRHTGKKEAVRWRGIRIPASNVELGCVKGAEDGKGIIVRLFETEGRETADTLECGGRVCNYEIGAYEILTLYVPADPAAPPVRVNLLEEEF